VTTAVPHPRLAIVIALLTVLPVIAQAPSGEQEVNLDELDAPAPDSARDQPAPAPAADSARPGRGPKRPSGHPGLLGGRLEAAFVTDATFEVFAGEERNEISFSSNHEYLILGVKPGERMRFAMEIIERVYWAFEYDFTPRFTFKVGKLPIPFGPLFLHQVLGGLVEKPMPGGGGRMLLVPEAWAEYGLEADNRWVDAAAYSLESKVWVTNGLQGTVDMANQTVDFTGSGGEVRDNNADKAVGLRLTNRFFGAWALSLSGYTCVWAAPDPGDAGMWDQITEGDRLVLGNADAEMGFGAIPVPVLRDLRLRGQYSLLRTRSTYRAASQDNTVPWHNKSASTVEATWRTPWRWLHLRYRFGTYDDNWNVRNSRDLVNHNVSLEFRFRENVTLTPTYFWCRERVNEKRDDFLLVKFALQI